MKRNLLIQLLQNYSSLFPEEISAKQQILDFVQSHENCFERSLAIGHITASSWLLNKDHSKALIMHHSKLDKWVQPGGHCDGNADVLAVAVQEAQEESGIEHIMPVKSEIFDLDIHLIPENPREKAHYHYDIRFLLAVGNNEDFKQNSESKELRWIDKNKASLPTSERSVVRLFEKWLML